MWSVPIKTHADIRLPVYLGRGAKREQRLNLIKAQLVSAAQVVTKQVRSFVPSSLLQTPTCFPTSCRELRQQETLTRS